MSRAKSPMMTTPILRAIALNNARDEAATEAAKAMFTLHPRSFHNLHEAFAVLYEEVDELWEVVRMKSSGDQEKRKRLARAEAKQVAAMALRLMAELT